MESRDQKLLDQVRDAIRLKHFSIRTEKAYVNWVRRCIYFHEIGHPAVSVPSNDQPQKSLYPASIDGVSGAGPLFRTAPEAPLCA